MLSESQRWRQWANYPPPPPHTHGAATHALGLRRSVHLLLSENKTHFLSCVVRFNVAPVGRSVVNQRYVTAITSSVARVAVAVRSPAILPAWVVPDRRMSHGWITGHRWMALIPLAAAWLNAISAVSSNALRCRQMSCLILSRRKIRVSAQKFGPPPAVYN